jgi:putative ABC transport system ATP-binding protein
MNASISPAVRLERVQYRWRKSDPLLLDIDALAVKRGERLFLKGPSGSGKSTLLNLLGGVVTPERGRIEVLGTDIESLSGARRDAFRADHVGFVFQMFNLIPYLSVLENVVLPCHFSAARRGRVAAAGGAARVAADLLARLGLAAPDLLGRAVNALSIGQQQRVATARALIGAPELVIADEPTSALDADTREAFLKLLFDRCAEQGTTLVFVSHDTSLAPLFDRTVAISDLNRVAGSDRSQVP